MSVRNGFTIEIYGFTHSLRTSSARAAQDAFAMELRSKIPVEDYARTSPDVAMETVNCSTKG